MSPLRPNPLHVHAQRLARERSDTLAAGLDLLGDAALAMTGGHPFEPALAQALHALGDSVLADALSRFRDVVRFAAAGDAVLLGAFNDAEGALRYRAITLSEHGTVTEEQLTMANLTLEHARHNARLAAEALFDAGFKAAGRVLLGASHRQLDQALGRLVQAREEPYQKIETLWQFERAYQRALGVEPRGIIAIDPAPRSFGAARDIAAAMEARREHA